jgi:microtubule-associated protein-like 6
MADVDEDADGTISLKEFISYVNRDKEILTVVKTYGISTSEDLGRDFGRAKAEVPDVDSDLEEEINPSDLYKNPMKDFIKDSEIPSEDVEKDLALRRKPVTADEKKCFTQ